MPQEIQVDLIKTGGKLELPKPPPDNRISPPKGETPPKTEEAKPETHDHDKAVVCRLCGHDQSQDPAEPTDEELTAYSRAVWAGVSYTHSVELFDGAVTVVFDVPSPDETRAVELAVVAEAQSGKLTTPIELVARSRELSMGMCVRSLRVGKKVTEFEAAEKPFETDIDARVAKVRAAAVMAPTFTAVGRAYSRFSAVINTIVTRASNPSFSRATAAAGASQGSPSPANRG